MFFLREINIIRGYEDFVNIFLFIFLFLFFIYFSFFFWGGGIT